LWEVFALLCLAVTAAGKMLASLLARWQGLEPFTGRNLGTGPRPPSWRLVRRFQEKPPC